MERWEEGFFVLSKTSPPLPARQPHPPDSAALPRVYSAGDASAVWCAGDAFIKIHDIKYPQVTREHVTLAFLRKKEPLGFAIPTVLYHGEWQNRYYLVLSRVPGRTLTEAWPAMDEETRRYYIQRVAEVCEQMAQWKGQAIGGVDGGQVMELYLEKGSSLRPEDLHRTCAAMGMDVSHLVFYHCDLGPGNVIVDTESKGIGIIDWEIAGYLPKEWVRTKFHLSSGMDFPNVEDEDAKSYWQRFVARKLSEMGFEEAIDGWLAFRARAKNS
ncbi:kinase-like protein [Parathielavia hyrcaniae]|uniref:Kinase-like protein n=1 Tax=Parathielavia hyrcaniae TaxID=113614 RepID=A0AAN6PVF5_9PEZI|nr:kinase-like protein [Parathielavia hyrcaniae]